MGILFTFEKEDNSDERLNPEDIVLCDIKPKFVTPSSEAGGWSLSGAKLYWWLPRLQDWHGNKWGREAEV